MTTVYQPSQEERRKYLNYIKNKGITHDQKTIHNDVTFDYISRLSSQIMTVWGDTYNKNQLDEYLSEKLFFEPINEIINDSSIEFTPYFKPALKETNDPYDYYGSILLEMSVNNTLSEAFKSTALRAYLSVCISFGVQAELPLITLFSPITN